MRPSWKLALIGGEVTVLAAFTGLGIHLAIQPHRTAFRPPPLVLPSLRPPVIPTLLTPVRPPAASVPPRTTASTSPGRGRPLAAGTIGPTAVPTSSRTMRSLRRLT